MNFSGFHLNFWCIFLSDSYVIIIIMLMTAPQKLKNFKNLEDCPCMVQNKCNANISYDENFLS